MPRISCRPLYGVLLLIIVFLSSSITPAQAAFVMTGGLNDPLPVTGNDYNGNLSGLGFNQMREGAYLSVDQTGFVAFYYIGAESTYSDTFTVTEHPSSTTSSITEPADNDNVTDPMTPFTFGGVPTYPIITIAVSAGERLDFQFSNNTNGNIVDNTLGYFAGRLYDLGIFYDSTDTPLDQVVLAYDDQFSLHGDDNHDDILIRAVFSPVPVPATVWLFGSGLIGLAGLARRRRAA